MAAASRRFGSVWEEDSDKVWTTIVDFYWNNKIICSRFLCAMVDKITGIFRLIFSVTKRNIEKASHTSADWHTADCLVVRANTKVGNSVQQTFICQLCVWKLACPNKEIKSLNNYFFWFYTLLALRYFCTVLSGFVKSDASTKDVRSDRHPRLQFIAFSEQLMLLSCITLSVFLRKVS